MDVTSMLTSKKEVMPSFECVEIVFLLVFIGCVNEAFVEQRKRGEKLSRPTTYSLENLN